MRKLKKYLIELLTEHIRQMEEEEHTTAFSSDDLKEAKMNLKSLKKLVFGCYWSDDKVANFLKWYLDITDEGDGYFDKMVNKFKQE